MSADAGRASEEDDGAALERRWLGGAVHTLTGAKEGHLIDFLALPGRRAVVLRQYSDAQQPQRLRLQLVLAGPGPALHFHPKAHSSSTREAPSARYGAQPFWPRPCSTWSPSPPWKAGGGRS